MGFFCLIRIFENDYKDRGLNLVAAPVKTDTEDITPSIYHWCGLEHILKIPIASPEGYTKKKRPESMSWISGNLIKTQDKSMVMLWGS